MPCRLILSSPPFLLRDGGDIQAFRARLLASLAGGDVAAFVLRVGDEAEATVRAAVTALCAPLQEAGVAFLLEGRADLAGELGCDGVQVPADREAVAAARRALGPDAIVGALCDSGSAARRHAAMEAAEATADYVAFPSDDVEALGWWAELMEVPCVAWDALPEQAAALAETGAEFLALAPSLWEDPDPAAAIGRLKSAIA